MLSILMASTQFMALIHTEATIKGAIKPEVDFIFNHISSACMFSDYPVLMALPLGHSLHQVNVLIEEAC